jgi:hypothetical protein
VSGGEFNRQSVKEERQAFESGSVWGKICLAQVAILLMLILASGRDARAESSFFEDKTVRLVLGFSPGGISDLWGRAIAQGMSQHIPASRTSFCKTCPTRAPKGGKVLRYAEAGPNK